MSKNVVLLSILIAGLSACAPCDYERLSKLPSESSVPEEHKEKVTFIKEVRKFGIEQLGLKRCTQHYTTYSETNEEAKILYRLFVTKPTVLPNTWGEATQFLENQALFREDVNAKYFISFVDTLEDELRYYKQEGYDVYARNTTNYNLIESNDGSSITPSFLNYTPEWQANTILHEICHDTLEAMIGDLPSEIDEPYCMLFGYAGSIEYFKVKKGIDSEEYTKAMRSFVNSEDIAVKTIQSYQKLQELYKSEKSLAQQQQEREAIFVELQCVLGEEVNNAQLCDKYPYTQYYPLMLQLYRSHNNDLPKILGVMKDCPPDTEKALKYIREIIKNN